MTMADEYSLRKEITKGFIQQNAVFVLALGLCPTLAVTTGLKNAVAMGIAVIAVMVCSNFIISLFRRFIPEQVRIPCFIVIIASFVTMVDILFKAYLPPEINAALGIFIPLIVVNCAILNRAEAFAYNKTLGRSVLDGLGIGLGFTISISLLAAIREALGSGTLWDYPWVPSSFPLEYVSASVMIQAPGAFLALGLLMGLFNRFLKNESS